jgi:flagellar protein FliS
MWNDAYLESKILSADPMELVQMLYQAALDRTCEARDRLARGDITGRSASVSKAMAIISELTASLNHEAGGEISRNLAELYDYMLKRLLDANFKQIDGPLAETEQLLRTLLEGWRGARQQVVSQPANVSDRAAQDDADSIAGNASPWAIGFGQEPTASATRGWSL